jgi:hypothetical protein
MRRLTLELVGLSISPVGHGSESREANTDQQERLRLPDMMLDLELASTAMANGVAKAA